jgi:predicted transcriptional regulator
MEEIAKVTFKLPESDLATLKQLAARKHTSVTAILRSAIATERFIDEEVSQGSKVLIDRNGTVRELVIR